MEGAGVRGRGRGGEEGCQREREKIGARVLCERVGGRKTNHLIAAHMHELVREERSELCVELGEECVRGVAGWVERSGRAEALDRLARFLVVARRENGRIERGVAHAHVAGCVEFRNHTDATSLGVGDDGANVVGGVDVVRRVCPGGGHLREGRRLVREGD